MPRCYGKTELRRFMVAAFEAGFEIGYTSGRRVAPRIAALQTATPHELELVDQWEGDTEHERFLHEQLAKRRVRGEWFQLTHKDLIWLAGIGHMHRAVYGYPDFPGQPLSLE